MLNRRNEIPHVEPPEILWENKIGTGRFGTVYLVNHEQERAHYIKIKIWNLKKNDPIKVTRRRSLRS